jgi:antitoxin PrlF
MQPHHIKGVATPEPAMTKAAEILKILGTITERGQTTVPAAIRKMPALGKRDRSCFAGSPTALS